MSFPWLISVIREVIKVITNQGPKITVIYKIREVVEIRKHCEILGIVIELDKSMKKYALALARTFQKSTAY